MKKLLLIFVSILAFNDFASVASAASLNLTLEECISLALKNNDSIKAGYQHAEMYKQAAIISRTDFLPKLTLDAHYTQRDKAQTFIVGKDAFNTDIPLENTPLPAEDKDIYSLTLRLKQPVFTGGNLMNRYSNARILEKASQSDSDAVRNETIGLVKTAYYDVLKSLKNKEIRQHALKLKQERLRVIEERQKEGIATKEDLLLAKVDSSTEELELMRTDNDLRIKEKKLKDIIGIEPDTEISLADKLENKKLLLGLEESRNIALINRKDLATLQYRTLGAQKEINIARSRFFPDIYLEGSYTRQKETPLSQPELWAVMAKLEWDIFEWGRTAAEVKRARANYEKITSEYDSLKKEVVLDVERRWFHVKEAERDIEVSEERVAHAEEQYKNASLKYKEALIKTAELLEAETYLIKSRNEYFNSVYDLNSAMAEFEYSVSSDLAQFTSVEPVMQPHAETIQFKRVPDVASPKPQDNTPKGTENKDAEKVRQNKADQNKQTREQTISPDTPAVREGDSLKKGSGYALQVGAFKNEMNANTVLEALKASYPGVSILKVNGFSKVRINGIQTRQEGTHIQQNIEKSYKLKPLLIISHDI